MQFIANGPDIPDSLLEAHEDGRVVFFCGAGISYPAKLPGFEDLVIGIRDELGDNFSAAELALFKTWQYDRTLDSMERRLNSGRIGMRKALAKVLTTDLSSPEATATHAALLELAKTTKERRRLVTTNFDRIFEHVVERDKLSVESYAAPMLPIPKPSRWDGIVYLHGLLPESPSDTALNRLIITSGDFGQAYLTERWAARFVGELFRNYVVCFVGYSINDPILRYMMNALAADRLQGETTLPAYAFGDFKPGQRDKAYEDWSAKGVEPILYERKPEPEGHASLHKTLIAWADMHRDGALGKEAIVSKYASYPPQQSTKEDDYVGRVIWALCHPSGLPARRFAELTPPPPLSWLKPLSEARFGAADLSRFDLPSTVLSQHLNSFSLLSRPTPARSGPMMHMAHRGADGSSGRFDEVMFQLGRWLLRHLNDPELIVWLAESGGALHPVWRDLVQQNLRRLESLKTANPDAYAAELEASPAAVPGQLLRPFWDVLLAGRVCSDGDNFDLYAWQELFKSEGLSWLARSRLREHLAPKVTLQRPYSGLDPDSGSQRRSAFLRWELRLAAEYAQLVMKDLKTDPRWIEVLPSMLPDFATLLMDAMELRALLGDGADTELSSNYLRPSIAEHEQNTDFDDWTVLIDLVRDAWLGLARQDHSGASGVAQGWWAVPNTLFKRLALFAASIQPSVPPEVAVKWIEADDGKWLWSAEARPEVMPWLRSAAPGLDEQLSEGLQRVILKGPPASMLDWPGHEEQLHEHYAEIELIALLNLVAGGSTLTEEARRRHDELVALFPDTRLSENRREEFSSWTSSGVSSMSEFGRHTKLPRELAALIQALRETDPKALDGFWSSDDWRDLCTQAPDLAHDALTALAGQDEWPTTRWQTALSTWAYSETKPSNAGLLIQMISNMPDSVIIEARQAVSDWLRSTDSTRASNDPVFFAVSERLVSLCPETEAPSQNRPVDTAINHPVGKVTDAVLRAWYATKPQDNQPLPDLVKAFLSHVTDGASATLVHGRVLIASNIVALFRADAGWAKKHFLHFFDWTKSAVEAQAAWEGFLWTPRGHRELLEEIKPSLIETASRYAALGSHSNAFVDLLLFTALEFEGLLSRQELVAALLAFPQVALDQAANLLARSVRSAGDPSAYWHNRVKPFIKAAWPKSADRGSEAISKAFAQLCIWSKDGISDALSDLGPWIKPTQHPGTVYHELSQGEAAIKYPREALLLIDAVTTDEATWVATELKSSLAKILQGDETLRGTSEYRRLEEIVRRYSL